MEFQTSLALHHLPWSWVFFFLCFFFIPFIFTREVGSYFSTNQNYAIMNY